MKALFLSSIFSIASIICWAQSSADKGTETPAIVFKGKITFERKTNTHKQIDEMMKGRGGESSMAEMMKKQAPKYKTDIFELTFTDKKSIYKPAPNGIQETKLWAKASPTSTWRRSRRRSS